VSYLEPTPHEIRISATLQRVARKLEKLLVRETGERCAFLLVVNSARARAASEGGAIAHQAIGSYCASTDRETSAIMMLELLAKWAHNGEIPPVHELRDSRGQSLADVLGEGPH